ncbi:putative ribonuclease H-like domain-containing protein [Tanacetum coccineum]
MNVSLIPTTRIHKDHPKDQIIGDINLVTQTRRMTRISEELAMKVWRLVDIPKDNHAIGTKWVFRNKKDERGILVRNKARLVAQGYTQEEGIDYDKMDVKSAFLYATIKEEVYVCQPPDFEEPQFPDKVYKVEKALYGLHQAPRAWYKTLSTYLLENGFRRGIIDKTLFIKKDKGDVLLVQVYVDDVIFGSTKKSLCVEFESLMHKKFQMSSMGEITFFLGLQVMQRDDGIFISQDKYVANILKKFDFVTACNLRQQALNDKDSLRVAGRKGKVMSPPAHASRAKLHWGIAFATGRKPFTDTETKLRMKHTNRRVRIPKGLYPCQIKEKLTKKQVRGKWTLVKEMLMISKDGEISKFHEYHSSREEEPTEQPRALNKYGFVDHPELQMNEFAPHRLPQREGNMNGWFIEDEDEPLEHEASNNEVDSNLESTKVVSLC